MVLAIVVAAAIGSPAASAAALRLDRLGPVVGSVERPAARSHALAYWTKARIRAARPLEEIVVDRPGQEAARPVASVVPDRGPSFSVSGAAPGLGIPGQLRIRGRGPARPGAVSPDRTAARRASTFIRYPLEAPDHDPEAYPNTAHGKVFSHFPGNGGEDYVCSATVVPSNTMSVAMTAGHCLYQRDKGGFARNVVFVPAYHSGDAGGIAPLGHFAARKLWIPRGWQAHQYVSLDVAAISLAANESGGLVEDVAGSRGIRFNRKRSTALDAYGYPTEPPFDGITPWVCDAHTTGSDDGAANLPGPTPLQIACDLTGGASGGGWIVNQGPDPRLAPGFLFSVTSYRYQ